MKLTDDQKRLLNLAHAAFVSCDASIEVEAGDDKEWRIPTLRSLDVRKLIDVVDTGDGPFIVSLTDLGLQAKEEGQY